MASSDGDWTDNLEVSEGWVVREPGKRARASMFCEDQAEADDLRARVENQTGRRYVISRAALLVKKCSP